MTSYRVQPLLDTVVQGGFCIGCGACAALDGSPLSMRLNADGLYRPQLASGHVDRADGCDIGQVCPFYSSENEDSLAEKVFRDQPLLRRDSRLGLVGDTLAGGVADTDARWHSSSGGLVTWLLEELLRIGEIDGVLHVTPGDEEADGVLYSYGISRTVDEVRAGAKTRYYPVEFSRVAAFLRSRPGRYAFVGVPCYVKAIRLLARRDESVRASLIYCIALFCGHMKSTNYAAHLAWQVGIPPGGLTDMDFRAKRPPAGANAYGIRARGTVHGEPLEREAPVDGLHGTDWGLGLFKPRACDFCDDVGGEVADVAAGDAWLPDYVADSRGTSVAIVRNARLGQLLGAGASRGELELDRVTADDVAASQEASLRHRRDGLALRLWHWDREGLWRPHKRREPSCLHLPQRERAVVWLRERLARHSHTAFRVALARRRHSVFRRRMRPWILAYYIVRRGLLRGVARGLGLRRRTPAR